MSKGSTKFSLKTYDSSAITGSERLAPSVPMSDSFECERVIPSPTKTESATRDAAICLPKQDEVPERGQHEEESGGGERGTKSTGLIQPQRKKEGGGGGGGDCGKDAGKGALQIAAAAASAFRCSAAVHRVV